MNDNFLNFANTVYGDEQIYKPVRDKFAPYANVHITKGYLPGTLQEKSPEQIAYLHIDLNAPNQKSLYWTTFSSHGPWGSYYF